MMTSTANYSDVNIRPRRYRGLRSSKKSILYSDYNTEEETKNGNLGQRSISLTALPHNGSNSVSISNTAVSTSGPFLEPRMAQLETLEAKMASIEVSLSTAQRRKNAKKNGNGSVTNLNKTTPMNINAPASIFASIRSNTLIDTCRELEVLRNALKDKENTIQNLQGQINVCGRLTSLQPLDPSERRSTELKLQTLIQEEEARKSAIKKLNLSLEQIDRNEANIDVRIKQAELEYELGREELGLLGVREELRTLQARLEAKPSLTLYSSINSTIRYTMHSVQLDFDPKSPRFGAGNVDDKIGLFVLWAGENSGLQKGDRILEVNGKLTLGTSKDEMIRLLTVCPSKAEIVLLRAWTPTSIEEILRRENLRLTHRISYLEDQVSELLHNVPSKEIKIEDKQTEIFQKGCQFALLPTVNGKCGGKPMNPLDPLVHSADSNCKESNQEAHGTSEIIRPGKITNSVFVSINGCNVLGSPHKHQETNNCHAEISQPGGPTVKHVNHTKKCDNNDNSPTNTSIRFGRENKHHKKHFDHLYNLRNGSVTDNSYSLSDLERSNRRTEQYHSRLVDYSSETSYRCKSMRDRKKETDEDSICPRRCDLSEQENDRKNKPTPPKKPIRLSINRATSLQSVETGYSIQSAVRKIKRSHKGEAPPPPILQENKYNSSQHSVPDSGINSSKSEIWNQLNYHRSMNKIDQKWC